MPRDTIYVVQAFVLDEEGEIVPEPPVSFPSAGSAVERAKLVAGKKAGIIAFSRTGDADLGEYDDAVVMFQAGRVPEDME